VPVLALLSDFDADSPLNCDAGNMVRVVIWPRYRYRTHVHDGKCALYIGRPWSVMTKILRALVRNTASASGSSTTSGSR
jgi:hypothetical protein